MAAVADIFPFPYSNQRKDEEMDPDLSDKAHFKLIEPKAMALCREIAEERFKGAMHLITLNPMRSGSFNRVIAVKIRYKRKRQLRHGEESFILRYSSDGSDAAMQQATTLRFVRDRSDFLEDIVAETTFNHMDNNTLGRPYLIQARLPGHCLLDVFDQLNLKQKKKIARDIAIFIAEMDKIRSPAFGQIEFQHPDTKIMPGPPQEELYFPDDLVKIIAIPISRDHIESVDEFFHKRIQSRKIGNDAFGLISYRIKSMMESRNRTIARSYGELWDIARKLHDKYRVFQEKYFTFSHGDFEMRNILVEVTSKNSARLSGVVDWDEAMFVPRVLATKPPTWLWKDDYNERDRRSRDDNYFEYDTLRPENNDAYEIRKAFEDAILDAGFSDYPRLAYNWSSKLGRAVAHHSIYTFLAERELADIQSLVSDSSDVFWYHSLCWEFGAGEWDWEDGMLKNSKA